MDNNENKQELEKKESEVVETKQEKKEEKSPAKVKTRKKKRRFSKKQQIWMTIGGAVLAIAIIAGAVIYNANQSSNASAGPSYNTVEITNAEPLVFNGTVNAENTSEVYLDQTRGDISEILVADGQEITVGTPLVSYQSDEYSEQVRTQEQQIGSLNLAVNNAQTNLNSATTRRNELQTSLANARNAYNAADANTMEGQATRQEQQAMIDQYREAVNSQNDVITQSQQALDAANLDLSNANATLEDLRNRVSTQVAAEIDGVAVVNKVGQTNATVPVVQVISRGTIVSATVSEYDYARLAVNQTVTARPINSDREINGTITVVNTLPDSAAPSASGATNTSVASMANYTFTVKLDEDLQYGYSCQITLPLNELRLPETAIVTEEEQQFVYRYEGGKAVKTPITAEDRNGVFVVIEGLEEGNRVISNPDDQISDGLEVTVS